MVECTWAVTWKGCRRKLPWILRGTIQIFFWRNWGNPREALGHHLNVFTAWPFLQYFGGNCQQTKWNIPHGVCKYICDPNACKCSHDYSPFIVKFNSNVYKLTFMTVSVINQATAAVRWIEEIVEPSRHVSRICTLSRYVRKRVLCPFNFTEYKEWYDKDIF
jgi:hypothetical protein